MTTDTAAEIARLVLKLDAAPQLYAALDALVQAIARGETDRLADLASDGIAALRLADGAE